jgi:ADP-ribose pyrophosphatase YjhB (NUDIX family)
MESYSESQELFPHVSVDCVIFGLDGSTLKMLLMSRHVKAELNSEYNDYKFPGSLIYANEDLDKAAARAVEEITGLKNITLRQFHSFGAPDRASNPRDKQWLERASRHTIGRIVTIGYITLIKMNQVVETISDEFDVKWFDVKDTAVQLAFDHWLILSESLKEIRRQVYYDPEIIFDLLPKKFTARDLRSAYSTIFNRSYDVRNFYKKFLENQPYIIALNERESHVTHRAARYFQFDRKAYRKTNLKFKI